MTAEPPTWAPLTGADLPEVVALAGRAQAVDGGLPEAAGQGYLAGRYTGGGVVARGARDGAGVLVAAGAVRPGARGPMATGLVDPGVRGRGIGADLLDWALATAAAFPAAGGGSAAGRRITVETESLTEPAATLYAARGLRQIFAEDVMRLDLTGPPPDVPLPDGVRLEPWMGDTAERFFAVYSAAFAERPGFPGWSAARWIDWLAGDDEFRPDWCALAVDPEAGDVAFIACAVGWIVQVGVRPDQRHRRLGAGLVSEALRRMRAAGQPAVLLDVNVNNPAAGALYRRLGFEVIGRRARWTVDAGA